MGLDILISGQGRSTITSLLREIHTNNLPEVKVGYEQKGYGLKSDSVFYDEWCHSGLPMALALNTFDLIKRNQGETVIKDISTSGVSSKYPRISSQKKYPKFERIKINIKRGHQ